MITSANHQGIKEPGLGVRDVYAIHTVSRSATETFPWGKYRRKQTSKGLHKYVCVYICIYTTIIMKEKRLSTSEWGCGEGI